MRAPSFVASVTLFATALSPTAPAGVVPCPQDAFCELPRWDMPADGFVDAAGREIVVRDDVAAVGASSQQAVHVHLLTNGSWEFVDTLVPPPGVDSDNFGYEIAITDGHIAVGAHWDDTLADNAGAVYVYTRTSSVTWEYQETLSSPAIGTDAYFGRDLAGDGDLLAVGEPGAPGGGAVHIYAMGPSAQLVDTEQKPGSDGYGSALDLVGQTLVVGDEWDDELASDAGAVYVHIVDAIAGIDGGAKVMAPDGAFLDRFGVAVATDGQTVVVGAANAMGSLSGAVYVFGLVWPGPLDYEAKLTDCDPQDGSWFGGAVDVEGDHIVVTAWVDDSALVFREELQSVWVRETHLWASDGLVDTAFGQAVEMSGDYVFVGAPFADAIGSQSGAVYHFSLANDELPGGPCPCEHQPIAIAYGTGKAGTLGVPSLEMLGSPVLGVGTELVLTSARPGAPAFLLLGLGTDAIPFDMGTMYVQDPFIFTLPPVDAAGRLKLAYDLPVTPVLCGTLLAHQMLVLDPMASGPVGTAQSNGLALVPGS